MGCFLFIAVYVFLLPTNIQSFFKIWLSLERVGGSIAEIGLFNTLILDFIRVWNELLNGCSCLQLHHRQGKAVSGDTGRLDIVIGKSKSRLHCGYIEIGNVWIQPYVGLVCLFGALSVCMHLLF